MSMPENIDINGRTLPLIVHFREKTRHLRLRLNHKNQVVVSVPKYCSDRDVLSFVDKQHVWLEQQVACIPESAGISDWLAEHPYLSASGERFPLTIQTMACSKANYQFENGQTQLVFRIPETSVNFESVLLKLVKAFSKDALACRANHHARRLNLRFERLTVRDQASRWGSCSSKKCISLNWRLVLIEPELQDYVILHELAHLTEMNHSRRFWRLLDSYDPLRPDHESALREVAGLIMRVGRS